MAGEPKALAAAAGPVRAMLDGVVWVGRAAAWLILPIIALVIVSVTLAAFKVGTIVAWESDVFLFGAKLTLASLGDLQWHLFGAMLMLTLPGALVTDNHVRVDFLRMKMSARAKDAVDLAGHVLFLAPFVAAILWFGVSFAARAFRLDEGSNYDGLYDRFVVKSFIPIGFALLLAAGVGLIAALARRLATGRDDGRDDG